MSLGCYFDSDLILPPRIAHSDRLCLPRTKKKCKCTVGYDKAARRTSFINDKVLVSPAFVRSCLEYFSQISASEWDSTYGRDVGVVS